MPMSTPLIDSAALAAIQQRVLERKTRQHVANTFAAGQHRSPFRGQGVELEDTRPYHPGDDIRHMDWRATARSGKATMKVFREERQRQLFFIVDKTQSMGFGTRNTLKASVAATAACALIFSALSRHEPSAGLILAQHEDHYAPARSLDHAFALINAIIAPLAANAAPFWQRSDTDQLLHRVEKHTQRGYTVVLISDFLGFSSPHRTLLQQLAQQRQLIAIQISDPAEESLPRVGKVRLYSPLTRSEHTIDTEDAQLRTRFAQTIAQQKRDLRDFFSACNTPLHGISTQDDVLAQLESLW